MDNNMPYQDKQGRTCGFLNILEKESSTNSKRRYFILDPCEETLKFYNDNPNNLPSNQQSPCGEIRTAVISKVSEVSKKQKPKLNSCFVINHAGKTQYLQAESTEDMQGWIYALNNISKITVPVEESKNLNDPEAGYKTEIAGGVPIKIPIRHENTNESGASSESEESMENQKIMASSQPALKKGYCVKQGGVRKNWKRRYFVVNDGGLAYYSNEQSDEPLRHIPRGDITDVRKATMSPGARDNLFEVHTSKRTFYIQCDTPEDVQEWISAIEKLINNQASQRKSGGNLEPGEVDLSVTKVFPQNKWDDRLSKSMFVKKPGSVNADRQAGTSSTYAVHSQSMRGPRMGVYFPHKLRQPGNPPSEDVPSRVTLPGEDKSRKVEKPESKAKPPLTKQRSWFLW
ncbi:pleckstrin homology domain-containing family A member 1-like [Saccostrea echinata]|uniref:pleckstrin homology domain-containing family A member 1-like n=1 Tax=Saccostrea echinata TaxID=191078 RepID=UPI002A801ADC|nr:pleckstrin homology domain-containing family A member 1-like [Saccostrea echinata]